MLEYNHKLIVGEPDEPEPDHCFKIWSLQNDRNGVKNERKTRVGCGMETQSEDLNQATRAFIHFIHAQ